MAFLVQENFLIIQELIQRENSKAERRYLRDVSNPFELPDGIFKNLFRLNKEAALGLINELNNYLPEGQRTTHIPNHLKVLLTLNFYAHGCYQSSVGTTLHFPSSQASVSRIVNLVTDTICERIVPREIRFPHTESEVAATVQEFMNKFHFPGVLGCIDCTHVAIINPPENNAIYPGAVYYNRKGYASINIQVICNARLIITSINARYPGSTHDAAIWQMSSIREHMQQKYFEGRENIWLLGDSGYPLQPWLMTSVIDAESNSPEAAYTECHKKTRNIIERLFGVLKNRFRCLIKHRVLHYAPTKAAKIAYACAPLHNICMKANIDIDDLEQMDNEEELTMADPIPRQENINILTLGNRTRRAVVNYFR